MGRRGKKELILFILLTFNSLIFSQTIISGFVKEKNGNSIPSASIILKDSLGSSTIGYTFLDQNGNYKLTTNQYGHFKLSFSSLGYKTKIISITVLKNQSHLNLDIKLEEQPIDLKEVIIRAEKPISILKDTILFKTRFFTNGTEQTVEDLLKKIPGLNVDSNGIIKVGNQEIEKLMIDGDDLFEKGYKILSKNMSAYPIEEVEVLKRYSNNRLLKDIEESNKIALNLKLKEDAKRIWFGNAELGIGNDGFYQLKGNLMNFGKKNKYFFLANGNSVGYDTTGDIQNLIRPFRSNEPSSIGDNQHVSSLLNLSAGSLNFKRSRTNFNNAELVSLNAIFNPTEKLKIKTLGFFNWDETDFYRNKIDNVNANNTNFTN